MYNVHNLLCYTLHLHCTMLVACSCDKDRLCPCAMHLPKRKKRSYANSLIIKYPVILVQPQAATCKLLHVGTLYLQQNLEELHARV